MFVRAPWFTFQKCGHSSREGGRSICAAGFIDVLRWNHAGHAGRAISALTDRGLTGSQQACIQTCPWVVQPAQPLLFCCHNVNGHMPAMSVRRIGVWARAGGRALLDRVKCVGERDRVCVEWKQFACSSGLRGQDSRVITQSRGQARWQAGVPAKEVAWVHQSLTCRPKRAGACGCAACTCCVGLTPLAWASGPDERHWLLCAELGALLPQCCRLFGRLARVGHSVATGFAGVRVLRALSLPSQSVVFPHIRGGNAACTVAWPLCLSKKHARCAATGPVAAL